MKKDTGFKIQVNKDHYYSFDYDSKERWTSYWYQIKEVLRFEPKTVLEIGVGNKTVSDYLNKMGIKVTTVDIDKKLKPDIVASVLDLPFNKNNFDVILCAEVLEHLPFKHFKKSLSEIKQVCKISTILTLPHFSVTNLYFGVKLIPFVPKKEFAHKIDFPIKHNFLGEHFWEIGKKGYELKRVKEDIMSVGFKIEKSFYPRENPRHHFFILSK